ncbi:hypothetical protein [Ilumatobacter sp.]|uniref:hypothetical protein n=1 Tax=Ilumatobacter sp. TaxID=1967498 RepID=UPI0037517ABD
MNSNRRTRCRAAGVLVLIVGLLAAGGLWYSAGQRPSDAVRNFARAPVGCDTTLNFEVAGEFLVFVETKGEIGGVTGSCGAPGAFGQLGTPQDLPPVRLVLTGPDGADIALDTRTGVDYDAAGSAGQLIQTFVVEIPGDHVLRVESKNDSEPAVFAIAIGRDPNRGVQPLQLGAFAAGIAGLIVGLLLIAMSRRRRTPEVTVPADPWSSSAPWPTSPPVAQQPPQAAGWQPQPGPPMQAPVTPVQSRPPGQPPFTTPTAPPSAPSPWAPPEMPSQ